MYRCEVCARVSEPRQTMLKHTITRERPASKGTETAHELAICQGCRRALVEGTFTAATVLAALAYSRFTRLEGERQRRAEQRQAKRALLDTTQASAPRGRGAEPAPEPVRLATFPPAGVAPKRRTLAT